MLSLRPTAPTPAEEPRQGCGVCETPGRSAGHIGAGGGRGGQARPGRLSSLLRTRGRLPASSPTSRPRVLGYVCGYSPLPVSGCSGPKARPGVMGASGWWGGRPRGTVSELRLQSFPASPGQAWGSEAPVSEPLCS